MYDPYFLLLLEVSISLTCRLCQFFNKFTCIDTKISILAFLLKEKLFYRYTSNHIIYGNFKK